MAAKRTEKKKAVALPEGYVPVRTRLDGFFEREVGNTVQGIMRGTMKVNGKFGGKNVFRIEVTHNETQIGDGEMIGPGGVIGLDETGYTSALGDVEPGTAVFVRYEGLLNPKTPASKTNPHIFTVGKGE